MNISEFINTNFIQGWSSPESYNWFDTMAYALLAIVLVYFTYMVLKKKIKFTYKSVLYVTPFILLGSFVRVFADVGIYPRFFWTVTPGVWIIFLTLSLFGLYLDERFKTKGKITVIAALVGIIPHLFMMKIVNPTAIFYFILFYTLSLAPFILLRKKFKLLSTFNIIAIASHLFDATSSFVNVDFFNYIEIHVIGGYFANMFDTGAVMYVLKLLVLLPVLYYIDKEKEKNLKNYLKLIICALGLGPGIRNLITVLIGV